MIYIREVKSNVKRKIDVTLGPKTLIVGPNGSGKSAIADAVTLALTGQVDSVAGKDISQEVALQQLKCDAADAELFADVKFSGANAASWRSAGTGASAKRAVRTVPDFVTSNSIPLRQLRDLTAGNQDALRALFMEAIGSTITRADVEARISDVAKAFVNDRLNPLYALSNAIDEADRRKREASAAVRAFEKAIPPAVTLPSEDQIQIAKHKIDILRVAREGALKPQREAEKQFRDNQNRTGVDLTPLRRLIDFLKHMPLGKGTCPACGQDATGEQLASRLTKAKARLAKLESDHGIEPDFMPSECTNNLSEIFSQYDAAQAELSRLEQAKATFEAYAKQREVAAKAKLDVARWKMAEEELTAARDSLLEQKREAFEQRVQRYLPSHDQFRLVLSLGTRRVCQFGFERNGHVDTALSGGEWCRCMIALGCALTENETIAVIIPPDCSMDPNTLSDLLDATVDAPAQIILCTTTMPARLNKKWTVIKTPLSEEL